MSSLDILFDIKNGKPFNFTTFAKDTEFNYSISYDPSKVLFAIVSKHKGFNVPLKSTNNEKEILNIISNNTK